jgi:hypothetical protein
VAAQKAVEDQRMRMHASVAGIFLALTLAACGSSSGQVPVKGEESQLASIAGEWEGEYKGDESGRSGPVHFSLGVGRHTAEGTVVMSGQTPLQIKFVDVEGGSVHGTIEPYTDPSCSCQVQTEFVGLRSGDRIEGTFITKVVGTDTEQHGSWNVTRTGK